MSETDRNFKRMMATKQLIMDEILSAHPSMLTCTSKELLKICNGCGSSQAAFDYIPDRIFGRYIGHACAIHDYDYYIGGSDADKAAADLRFRNNLKILLSSGNKLTQFLRYQAAHLYYKATRQFGKKSFNHYSW